MKCDPNSFLIDINKVRAALLEMEPRIINYFEIMRTFHTTNVKEDTKFRTLFNGFYRIMKKKPEFYNLFYSYLEQHKSKELKYEDVLQYFYKEFGRIEKSFSSKLLATVNPNMPVWDTIVLSRLGMIAPAAKVPNRFERTVEMYYDIVEWYKIYLTTDNAKEAIQIFDDVFPCNSVTNIKKIDLVLWSIRN